MISEIVWRRMLYVGTGLITAVAAIYAIMVIPHVISDKSTSVAPESTVPAISILVIIHLLFIVALIWTIKVNKRGDQINKELLVGVGVILIGLSLLRLDDAFAYIDKPGLHGVGISMLICIGCDFVAGLLALIARYFLRPWPLSK